MASRQRLGPLALIMPETLPKSSRVKKLRKNAAAELSEFRSASGKKGKDKGKGKGKGKGDKGKGKAKE